MQPRSITFRPAGRWRLPAVFFIELLLLAALAAWKVPFSYPEGDIALNALDVLRTGHVHSTFLPGFYPWLMAHAYAAAGPAGFVVIQLVFFISLGLVTVWAMRLAGRGAEDAWLAGMVILLDPDLAAAIPKAIDSLLTAALLLLLTCLCLRGLRRNPDWLLAACMGVTWGVALAVRPNLILLVVPLLGAVRGAGGLRWLSRALLVLALAACSLAAANIAAHGSFYLPQNGPYNFFAGANPLTQQALTHGYNAELSIPGAFAGHTPPGLSAPLQPQDYYNARLNPEYTRLALGFVAHHPLQWLWLGVLKLFALLRPSLRNHAAFSISGFVEIVTSLCVPLWLILLVAMRRQRDRTVEGLFLMMAAAYVLPFLLTNADTRFRLPLDVLVLTHAAILVLRRREVLASGG